MSTKEESRQKILQAAFEAFAENGYEKTSMDDIVKRSGLSKGTLYWHFTNKRELFLAAIQTPFQLMDMQLNALIEQEDMTAEDRICEVDAHMTAVVLMAGGDGVTIYMLLDPAWDVPTALNLMVEMIISNLKKESPDR
jgi:DNA-binding transcriptional regulator YbjK